MQRWDVTLDANSPDVRYSLGVLRVRRPDGDFVSFGTNVNDGTTDVSAVGTEPLTDETQQLQEEEFKLKCHRNRAGVKLLGASFSLNLHEFIYLSLIKYLQSFLLYFFHEDSSV